MNAKIKLYNHEKWFVCAKCGHEYDMRLEGFFCPVCMHNNK